MYVTNIGLASKCNCKTCIFLFYLKYCSFNGEFTFYILLVFDRHVMLPPHMVKLVPKTHLLSETEWRNIGVQQSPGWIHYMLHKPGICIYIVLF